MSLTKEDLIIITLVNVLNKAVESGSLKLPANTKPQLQKTAVTNLRVRVPSPDNNSDDSKSQSSREDSPDIRLDKQQAAVKKIIKKVGTSYAE